MTNLEWYAEFLAACNKRFGDEMKNPVILAEIKDKFGWMESDAADCSNNVKVAEAVEYIYNLVNE